MSLSLSTTFDIALFTLFILLTCLLDATVYSTPKISTIKTGIAEIKDIDPNTLSTVIKNIAKGACWIDPNVAHMVLRTFPKPDSTQIVQNSSVQDIKTKLLVVGDGPAISELKDLVNQFKINDYVKFVGKVNINFAIIIIFITDWRNYESGKHICCCSRK